MRMRKLVVTHLLHSNLGAGDSPAIGEMERACAPVWASPMFHPHQRAPFGHLTLRHTALWGVLRVTSCANRAPNWPSCPVGHTAC